jgi:hypothetical protein
MYVEVRADGTTYQQAIPNSPSDWSSFSANITIPRAGPTTLVAHAIDVAGNQQWFTVPVTAQ